MFLPLQYAFFCPAKFNSGERALENLPVELDALNARKPLILADAILSAAGPVRILIDAFRDSGMTLDVCSDIPANPDLKLIRTLAGLYRNKGCDAVIAVGGGVLVATAKVLNIVLSGEPEDLERAAGEDRIEKPLKPLVWVPSGPSDGYESSRFAALGKTVFVSHYLIPPLIILDPRMTVAMDAGNTAASALIALAHAVEAYAGPAKNPMTDTYAYTAISLVMEHLIDVIKNPRNREGRLALANATAMAGCAFSNAPKGLTHALGSALGGCAGLPPGLCMGMLLPYVLEQGARTQDFHLADLLIPLAGPDVYAATVDSLKAQKALDILFDLPDRLSRAGGGAIPQTLAGLKVTKEQMEATLQDTEGGNIAGWEDRHTILDRAWQGKTDIQA